MNSIVQSENDLLRQQISDLQTQLDMQAEINLLRQEIFDLKTENTRLNHIFSTFSKQDEILSSDDEYYTTSPVTCHVANNNTVKGLNKIDRYCKYCNHTFKYPCMLKHHLNLNNNCKRLHNQ